MSMFISGFADDLQGMIDLRVTLNYSASTYLSRAKSFDKNCAEHFPETDELTEAVVISWICPDAKQTTGVLHQKIAFARAFGKYLKSIGKKAYIIPECFTSGRHLFVPYILNDQELTAFFREVDRLEYKSNPFRGIVLSTYFRLTYTCGLRPAEGRELKRVDVDLNSGEVRINHTKWHKCRTVVMSDDMLALARKYSALRDSQFPDSDYFFPNKDGGPYTSALIRSQLKRCFAASKPDIPAELLPMLRVYDLRHRFATTVLSRWLDAGEEMTSRLTYLQTYMGHKELQSTLYYVHLLPENLVKASGVDWEHMNSIIPRAELWER